MRATKHVGRFALDVGEVHRTPGLAVVGGPRHRQPVVCSGGAHHAENLLIGEYHQGRFVVAHLSGRIVGHHGPLFPAQAEVVREQNQRRADAVALGLSVDGQDQAARGQGQNVVGARQPFVAGNRDQPGL